MIDGRLKMVTISPLNRPRPAPETMARAKPTASGQSGWSRNTIPARIAEKPRIEPIERSTWRAMMTIISPIAATMTSGIGEKHDAPGVGRQKARLDSADHRAEDDQHHQDACLAGAQDVAERGGDAHSAVSHPW